MRILVALAAGMVIGVILIEATSSGLSLLLPESAMSVRAADGFASAVIWPLLPAPALVWMLGGFGGGTMAAAAGPHPAWGLAVGLLLALPAFVIVGLVTPGNPLALLAAALPLVGAAAGTALVLRLRRGEASVSAAGQSV